MTTFSTRPLLPSFLPSLNALLAALSLPFTLDDPTDLTPSLLLAIFESLINARLPIPPSVRQSRTRDAKSRAMLVLLGVLECDVLRGGTADGDPEHSVAISHAEDSVLGGAGGVSVDGWVDEIGLGEVDPELLADGGWDETIFVGELLCWLARRKGILPRARSSRRSSHPRSLYSNHHSYGTEGEGEGDTADFSMSLLLRPSSSQKARSPRPPSPSPSIGDPDADPDFSVLSHITDVPRHPLVHSPEPSLSASATTGTDLSLRARSVSSRTSVSNAHDDPDEFEDASQDTVQMYDPRRMMQDAEEDDDRPPTFRPHCIHELEDPSYVRELAGSSSFNSYASHDRVPEEEDPSVDEEEDHDDPYAPSTPTPQRVRLTGWIDHVDAASELDHFASSRAYTRSRAHHTSAGSDSGPSSRTALYRYARTGELSEPSSCLTTEISPPQRTDSSKSRTPRRVSPSPSPPPPMSSKRPSRRVPSSPPPSPPSPNTTSDSPFDVSFSTLNNTSTPAKPRPPRRSQFQTTARHEIETEAQTYVGVDKGKGRGNTGTEVGSGSGSGRLRSSRRDRSPSYTPSPPSFTTPGGQRSGNTGTATRTRLGTSAPGTTPTQMRNSASSSTMPAPPSASTKGKSPAVPTGSTTTTNALLTERARLLTELAALKRIRAASGAGGTGMSVGTSSSRGVASRRVGVGV